MYPFYTQLVAKCSTPAFATLEQRGVEVRVQHEAYRYMSGTYLEAILSQKNWTGLAGVLSNGRNQSKYDFCSVGWPLLVKNLFFPFLVQVGPNHSEMVPNGPKVVSDNFFAIWDHF